MKKFLIQVIFEDTFLHVTEMKYIDPSSHLCSKLLASLVETYYWPLS